MKNQATMDRKSYRQICPISTALDTVGERWTLLIIRELLGGAARFNELQDGLQGIPKNLLSNRLKQLEADEIVERVKMYGSVFYSLTENGYSIRTALEEFGFWGARLKRVAPVEHQRSVRAIAMALQAILVRAGDALPADRCLIELEIDGQALEIVLGKQPDVIARPSVKPDARISISGSIMSKLLLGKSVGSPDIYHKSGSTKAVDKFVKALGVSKTSTQYN